MILNCSSYETAKASLEEIFSISEKGLVALLKSSNPYDQENLPPEDALYNYVCGSIGYPKDSINVLWFHGTRVEDESLFYEHGILTKTDAREFIEPKLKQIADGLTRAGSNPFSSSLSGKNGQNDEGPFAFLIRELAIQAPSPCHNYLDAPELVEDLAGIMLGQNYMQLVDRFKNVTRPCVVAFLAQSKGYEIQKVLLYVKLVVDGEADLEAASIANTFYNSEGVTISPDRIQSVEIIKDA